MARGYILHGKRVFGQGQTARAVLRRDCIAEVTLLLSNLEFMHKF